MTVYIRNGIYNEVAKKKESTPTLDQLRLSNNILRGCIEAWLIECESTGRHRMVKHLNSVLERAETILREEVEIEEE